MSFFELRVDGAYGGFPPDYLYWNKNQENPDNGTLIKFSGHWEPKPNKRKPFGSLFAGFNHRPYDWQPTDNTKVDIVPKYAGKIFRSDDNKSYKVVGFRNCDYISFPEYMETIKNNYKQDFVIHRLDTYTLVVEVLS